MNLERRKRNRQLSLHYLCAAADGPTVYLGQDMKTAHAGIRISASDWQAAMDHVERALVKFKVADTESTELLALIDRLADQIVES
jgi:hemoglobin